MNITLIGYGCGVRDGLTRQAAGIIENADIIIGSDRLLDDVRTWLVDIKCEMISEVVPERIYERLRQISDERENPSVAVLYSGDAEFFSGAQKLSRLLDEGGYEYSLCPGISSVSAFACAIKKHIQDAELVSAR